MAETYLFFKIIGGFAALASAAAWAFSAVLFRKLGDKVSPLGMNFGKCVIGFFYLGLILLFVGSGPVTTHILILLGASGLLGIACGDTFFFKALMNLGPRLTLLLETLGPVVTIILAVIFLRERPSFLIWVGISLISGGITWVLWERSYQEASIQKIRISGVGYAILFILCNSTGIILAKIGVAHISALQGTLIRILWGGIGLTAWGSATRQLGNWLAPFKNPKLLRFMLFSVFIAIFGGFWLSLLALKYLDASVASILNSTTPLFILPVVAFILKEKISTRSIIGAIIAVAGVVLIFLG